MRLGDAIVSWTRGVQSLIPSPVGPATRRFLINRINYSYIVARRRSTGSPQYPDRRVPILEAIARTFSIVERPSRAIRANRVSESPRKKLGNATIIRFGYHLSSRNRLLSAARLPEDNLRARHRRRSVCAGTPGKDKRSAWERREWRSTNLGAIRRLRVVAATEGNFANY